MIEPTITVEGDTKKVRSLDYNYNFDYVTGYFERWGATEDLDPAYSPFGPEILDIEVTTKCKGPGGVPCPFCYKSNTMSGEYMTFDTFKTVFHKFPTVLTQIAFGADAQCETNPDIWQMMEYCRENTYNKVVPNITVADVSDEVADKLANVCGAVAVSRYANKDICYDSIKKLTDRGMEQINIHIMLSEETKDMVVETFKDYFTDPRLSKVNAIVLLSLKPKGRGEKFTRLSQIAFSRLIRAALVSGVPLGFDSCSAPKFIQAIKNLSKEQFDAMLECSEPCESFGMFSSYVNVKGHYYPCSFAEGSHESFMTGVDLTTDSSDLMRDVWTTDKTLTWRKKLIESQDEWGMRPCPLFNV